MIFEFLVTLIFCSLTSIFYALVNDQVLLIRLEDEAGRLIRNAYGAPNHTWLMRFARGSR